MVDITKIMNSPGVYQGAYQDAYAAEVANRQRQAETERLLQQAMSAREMQPYDIAHKQAQTENYNALTQKYLREPQQQREDTLAKAENIRRGNTLAKDYALLSGFSTHFDDIPLDEGMIKEFIDKLSPETQQFFKRGKQGEYFGMSKQLLEEAKRFAMMNHPEMAKTLRTDTTVGGANERNTATLESRERIAKLQMEFKTKAAKELAAAKTPKDAKELGVRYKWMADQEQDSVKKAWLLEESANAFAAAFQFDIAAAEARKGGQIDIGATTDLPTTAPPKPPTLSPQKQVTPNKDALKARLQEGK